MVILMNIAIALGGSVLSKNIENLDKLVEQIRKVREECENLLVVVGAGELKKYIDACSENASNAEKDSVGIRATRLSASVLKSYFDDVFPTIPSCSEELRDAFSRSDFVVMGGTEPGHSTDGVAAVGAELIDADMMIDVTDVNGVFEKEGGVKIDSMDFSRLKDVMEGLSCDPGTYSLIDRSAVDILERSDIKLVVVDGNRPGEIYKAVKGDHSGSVVMNQDR